MRPIALLDLSRRWLASSLLVFATCLGLAGAASAQTNIEVNASLELDLSQPGARSLAMGGAFIGLADDATAAYTNPAGLTNLSFGEISLEARSWDYVTRYTDGGIAFVDDGRLDASGLVRGDAVSSSDGLSFGAVAYPQGNVVFAIYRHQLAKYETAFDTRTARAFDETGTTYLFGNAPIQGSARLEIQGTGLAAALRLGKSFSLGIGVVSYDFLWRSRTRRFEFVDLLDFDLWRNQQEIVGDDEATAGTLGFEWKLSEHWRLGGVYRQGPEFDFSTRAVWGPISERNGEIADQDEGVFRTPNVFGLGIAYTTTSFRVLFDWVHVEYSSLARETVDVLADSGSTSVASSYFTVDNADELHLGFEFVFPSLSSPVAVRAGAWFDPDHAIRYGGPIESDEAGIQAMLFQPGDDEIHYTAGFGVAFADGRYELNAAADFSDRVDTASLSLVMRIF